MLWACSVRCRYLAITSKGWYGYGLSKSGRATWQVSIIRSSRLLYIHDASGSRNKLWTPRCNARRILLRHEAGDESSDHNSVSCWTLVTLWYYCAQLWLALSMVGRRWLECLYVVISGVPRGGSMPSPKFRSFDKAEPNSVPWKIKIYVNLIRTFKITLSVSMYLRMSVLHNVHLCCVRRTYADT
jgi:hypothetical protein